MYHKKLVHGHTICVFNAETSQNSVVLLGLLVLSETREHDTATLKSLWTKLNLQQRVACAHLWNALRCSTLSSNFYVVSWATHFPGVTWDSVSSFLRTESFVTKCHMPVFVIPNGLRRLHVDFSKRPSHHRVFTYTVLQWQTDRPTVGLAKGFKNSSAKETIFLLIWSVLCTIFPQLMVSNHFLTVQNNRDVKSLNKPQNIQGLQTKIWSRHR